ncbi:MAG: GTP 3',8-cyclase MoaA [Cytophagaceae bacterium]|nr:GTP 3',8-cyclase MoaA [Cytophagaceae bacterium]
MIRDSFGRSFKTLRVSLTDSCNLACTYCIPDKKHHSAISQKSILKTLSLSEYIRIISQIHELVSIESLRLTGGEPLLYKDIIPLVGKIKESGIPKVKLTTNGTLLSKLALGLKEAGLDSINLSLDAISEDVFFKVSKRRNSEEVIRGIDSALEAGIPVKINAVLMKGMNEDQILPLMEFAAKRKISIRFLELMNMGHLYHDHYKYFFSEEEILKTIAGKYSFSRLLREDGSTSKYWLTDNNLKFGIISNISDPFCHDCNRLRLNSYGQIFGCLSTNDGINIKEVVDDKECMLSRLQQALLQKQKNFTGSEMTMKSIGG